jgi:hypothetical protein
MAAHGLRAVGATQHLAVWALRAMKQSCIARSARFFAPRAGGLAGNGTGWDGGALRSE